MCQNNALVPNKESSDSNSDIVPVPSPTKTFAYKEYYVYGSAMEIQELKGFELEVVSVDEMVAYIINDIHTTYDKE